MLSLIQLSPQPLSFRQRWNHYLTIIFALFSLIVGASLRNQVLSATTEYFNPEVGIRARYPQNWLIDNNGNYIFRVRDMTKLGFKTTIQVAIQAIGQNSTARNVADIITLDRSQTLAVYDVLEVDDKFTLPDQTLATAVNYTYVAIEPNPLLQSIPVVVRGLDILTIRRGQVIIISFIADAGEFSAMFSDFENFLSDLNF